GSGKQGAGATDLLAVVTTEEWAIGSDVELFAVSLAHERVDEGVLAVGEACEPAFEDDLFGMPVSAVVVDAAAEVEQCGGSAQRGEDIGVADAAGRGQALDDLDSAVRGMLAL